MIKPPTLNDLEITKQQSSDWQQLAAIPEPEFEQRLAATKRDPRSMTTHRLLRPIAPSPSTEEQARMHRDDVWNPVHGWLINVDR